MHEGKKVREKICSCIINDQQEDTEDRNEEKNMEIIMACRNGKNF